MILVSSFGALCATIAWVYCGYKYDKDDRLMQDMKREASAYLAWVRERKMKFTKKELVDFIFVYKMEFAT